MTCGDLLAMISLMGDSHGFKLSGHGDLSPKEQVEAYEHTDGVQDFPYIPDYFLDSSKEVTSENTVTMHNDVAPLPFEYKAQTSQTTDLAKHEDQLSVTPTLEFVSTFHDQYWRNDRKNIQCFPYCPEFGDYLSMRLQNKEHGRASCTAPVVVRASAGIKFKGVQCVSRICFASDSLELQPGQKFEATDYDRIKEHLWKGNIVVADPRSGHTEIHFSTTKWKVYKTQCKTRKPLHMQRSTKYAFEAFLLESRDDGDYNVVAYAISTAFELASTRELSKQLHSLKSSSSSGAGPSNKRPKSESQVIEGTPTAKRSRLD